MGRMIQELGQTKGAAVVDISTLMVLGGALMELIPPFTALLSLIWVSMRLYITVLDILDRRKLKKSVKKGE